MRTVRLRERYSREVPDKDGFVTRSGQDGVWVLGVRGDCKHFRVIPNEKDASCGKPHTGSDPSTVLSCRLSQSIWPWLAKETYALE